MANIDSILEQLKGGILPRLQADYSGLVYDMAGQQRERRKWEGVVALSGVVIILMLVPALNMILDAWNTHWSDREPGEPRAAAYPGAAAAR